MLTQPLLDKLTQLRLPGLRAALTEQLSHPQYAELSFEDRLGLLLDQEATSRDNNRLRRLLNVPAPTLLGIPVEFVLFSLTLLGVALFHRHTMYVALAGLAAVSLFKALFTGFHEGVGALGWAAHVGHELTGLLNLLGVAARQRVERPAGEPDGGKPGMKPAAEPAPV